MELFKDRLRYLLGYILGFIVLSLMGGGIVLFLWVMTVLINDRVILFILAFLISSSLILGAVGLVDWLIIDPFFRNKANQKHDDDMSYAPDED